MQDTPDHINKIQHDLFLALPLHERFSQGVEMAIEGKKLLEHSIKTSSPGISDIELKIEVFKRMYSGDFTKDQLNDIFLFFKKHTEYTRPL